MQNSLQLSCSHAPALSPAHSYSPAHSKEPPDEYSNHRRFLTLLRYLIFHTNPEKMASREEISEDMKAENIYIDARTISKYVEEFNKAGFNIVKIDKGEGDPRTRYFNADSFSPSTPVVLSLLVEMTGFLSRESSDSLIREALSFAPNEIENRMRSACFFSNLAKTENREVCDNLNTLVEAILDDRMVSFHCYDLYYDGTRFSRHGNERCYAEPISIIPNNGKFYLWCIRTVKGDRRKVHLRIDYIEDIEIEEDSISEECVAARQHASEKYYGIFKMFDGEKIPVTLEFPNFCLRSVHDEFGYGISPKLVSGEGYDALERVTVNVSVSRYFYSWVFEGFPNMKIVAPESAVEGFRNYVEERFEKYQKEMQPAAATTDCYTTGKSHP